MVVCTSCGASIHRSQYEDHTLQSLVAGLYWAECARSSQYQHHHHDQHMDVTAAASEEELREAKKQFSTEATLRAAEQGLVCCSQRCPLAAVGCNRTFPSVYGDMLGAIVTSSQATSHQPTTRPAVVVAQGKEKEKDDNNEEHGATTTPKTWQVVPKAEEGGQRELYQHLFDSSTSGNDGGCEQYEVECPSCHMTMRRADVPQHVCFAFEFDYLDPDTCTPDMMFRRKRAVT